MRQTETELRERERDCGFDFSTPDVIVIGSLRSLQFPGDSFLHLEACPPTFLAACRTRLRLACLFAGLCGGRRRGVGVEGWNRGLAKRMAGESYFFSFKQERHFEFVCGCLDMFHQCSLEKLYLSINLSISISIYL